MLIFTNDDYRRIQAWLKKNAIKDSDFAISQETVPEEDILVITQNMATVPMNYKIKIKDLLNSSLGKVVINSIIAKSVKVNNLLTVDASNIKLDNKKGVTLQNVLDYFEDNKLNRHTDDTLDGNLTIKKNITIEGNIKSHDSITTVEADLKATGEITDGDGNILSDVNDAAKQWSLEYQDPQQDEPTVRAKYVLKDYKGVPKGNPIKVYKDSAITNVYLGTTEDTCNENTGEVTKKPIQNNNEALSIVYRLDTGKYSLVNVPIGIFIREAEFDKYRGLGITENGQVFIKLANDVESSNYLHFNASGELSADGIENRILQDLGTIINSVAGDSTMWGQYKKEEGTKDSLINEASRWGQYKQAEADRNERLNNLENKIEEEKTAIIDTNRIADGAVTTDKISDLAVTTDKIADEAVTFNKLHSNLQPLITNISKNSAFAGIATPTTNPGTPDGPVFYLATEPGVYSNFGGLEIKNTGLSILYNKAEDWQTLLVYEAATEEGDSNQITMSQKAITNSFKKSRAMALYNRIVLFGGETIPFTRGGFMNSTGQIGHAPDNYGYSDLIFLPKNGTYIITHQASNASHAVVFDDDLNVVEYHNSGTGDKTTIVTGDNDRYLVISNNFNVVANPSLEHDNSVYDTAIEDLQYDIQRYLQYSADYVSNTANEVWTENGYYTTKGAIKEDTRCSYCKAALNGGKYIFVDHCNIPDRWLVGIVFFNGDKVLLAQTINSSATSFTIMAPSGATHYGYSKLKTNTKAASYIATLNGTIGGKIPSSLLNLDADELITSMSFSKLSDPVTKAVGINSVLADYPVAFADYSSVAGYLSGNSTVAGPIVIASTNNWFVETINNNHNNIIVTGLDIASDGRILYLLLDENDNIIYKRTADSGVTHIDKLIIYAGKAAKVVVNHRNTTAFDAQIVNRSLVRTIDTPMFSNNVLSLFGQKDVEPTINWIEGESYVNKRGSVDTSLAEWRRNKDIIPGNAIKMSINHSNVAEVGKVVVLFWGDDTDTVLDAVIANSNSEDYSAEVPIPFGAKYWGINSRTTNNSVKVTFNVVTQAGSGISKPEYSEITVENSDKIAIIGDSYTESHYTIRGKAYINKMSLFSDYVFMNFAQSGDVYNGRLYAIRKNIPIYGNVPFAKYRPKFAMMCCFTNDIKIMNTNQFLECLQNIINVTKGLGTEPIVCTEYHTGYVQDSNIGVRSGLEDIARKNELMFWDIASYVDLIQGDNYAPFWGGSHPGSRANAIQSDNYEKYLLGLERPAKSIKLFRPRNTDISNLDNLMFNTNYERAKLFKEIFVGHSALNDSALVDNCTNATNSKVASEYQKLIEKTAVSFTNACLISAVLPVLADTLSYLALNLKDHTGSIKVYVKNSMASPYPSNTKYTRFDYTDLVIPPNIGDVYTASNDSNTKQFTVVGIVEGIGDGDAKGAIFCSPADTFTTAGGTLTRVSGSGDASIPYSYRAVGYLQGDLAKDTGGHWVEISQDKSGVYPIPADLIGSSVYTDRVDFLVVCENGDFTISDLSIKYNDGISKGYHRSIIPFETNYVNDNEELLPSNTFGAVGEVDQNWNVTPTDIYEHQHGTNTYPVGCSSKVDVTDTVYLEYTIPTSKIKNGSRKAILEIWCRYFPPIYSDGADGQITENSFDYNEIKVDIGVSSKNISTLSEKVNTHWKIVRFPIKLIKVNASKDTKVKIYSDTKGIEVVYVSLKYE